MEIRNIVGVVVDNQFAEASDIYGYDIAEWEEELLDLIEFWEAQGYVTIYDSNRDRAYGRAKDSSLKVGCSPYYIGFYHVRLLREGENDPLIVLMFRTVPAGEQVVMKLMINHDEMFGTPREKNNPEAMRMLRRELAQHIERED